MSVELFDTHAHLQEPQFASDVEDVIARANQTGVLELVLPAVDLATAHAALALARSHAGVYATAGYHPHEASQLDAASLAEIEALLPDERVVAVGEIGLDYYRLHSPREAQLETLDRMLDLAGRHTLPVVVHTRDAWEDAASILEPWARQVSDAYEGRPLGVMHYFTGTLEEALRYIELGFLISVHTSVTHPKSGALRDTVAALPLDAVVIETDSPYGAPQAYRGQRNEPAYVLEAAKQVAEAHQLPLEEVAKSTTANARRLFRLPVPAHSGRSASA